MNEMSVDQPSGEAHRGAVDRRSCWAAISRLREAYARRAGAHMGRKSIKSKRCAGCAAKPHPEIRG